MKIKSTRQDGSYSRTIKGLISVIVVVLLKVGIDLPEEMLVEAIELVAVAITAGYTAYGAILRVYNRMYGTKI